MSYINSFKVNLKKCEQKISSANSDGLMSKEDKVLLDSLALANKSNDANNITINAPEIDIINQEFESYNSQIEVNSKKIERLSSLIESQGYCGRVWDESNSTPVAKTYCGNLDMLRNLPDILGLGGYLVQNDHTRRKLSKETHYKFADDNSEAKLDGTMGHYQWGWNVPFYITVWRENNLHYECISLEPIKGRESYYIPVGSMSCAGHAAIDRETDTLVSYINNSPRYRGGNNNDEYDNDSQKTLLGRCVTNKTTVEFAEAARKNGDGWYAGTMRMNAVIQVLFHIIMGTRNSQSNFNATKNKDGLYECGLNVGVTGLVNDFVTNDEERRPFILLSECVDLGDYTGVSDLYTYTYVFNGNRTATYRIPMFFGLKNPFSYIWRMNEDEFSLHLGDTEYNNIHYIRKSLYDETYQYGIINDSVMEGSHSPNKDCNTKDMSYKNLEMWTTEGGGSDTTYYCDRFYNSSMTNKQTFRTVLRSGDSYSGLRSGISAIYLYYNITYANKAVGTPLCEFTEDFLLEPIKR